MAELTIVIPLYPEVTHLDFTGPHQVFSRIPGAKVIVASKGGVDIEADGLVFTKLADLADIPGCDVLCVPGGFGTTAAMLDEAFMAEVTRLANGARYLTSVCTGSLILAATGLITGKRAGCHWAWRDMLKPFGVIVDEARVVRDGNVITGGGVTAGLDFAFVMAAELAGETLAQSVQLGLEYSPSPPFNSGRPETAPPEILAAVRQRMDAAGGGRQAAAEEAARRLKARA
ncbi:DJ-1/PfpI family protein [Phenylobacterium aquaticum]|uniref:DJ-1/PfpI family protein n=1 Tax=Phenylobacterium aquaticum TaxID=1763816 RepID=UPI001F5D3578|nr:DJ-1/PfpI family protein [Phenylobacterium aquaticum]MCI3132339.1 DJ-1/PfpI family protein [Phenylobacterium aquaticum]